MQRAEYRNYRELQGTRKVLRKRTFLQHIKTKLISGLIYENSNLKGGLVSGGMTLTNWVEYYNKYYLHPALGCCTLVRGKKSIGEIVIYLLLKTKIK